jgi:hypothetical protein
MFTLETAFISKHKITGASIRTWLIHYLQRNYASIYAVELKGGITWRVAVVMQGCILMKVT